MQDTGCVGNVSHLPEEKISLDDASFIPTIEQSKSSHAMPLHDLPVQPTKVQAEPLITPCHDTEARGTCFLPAL